MNTYYYEHIYTKNTFLTLLYHIEQLSTSFDIKILVLPWLRENNNG